VRAFALAQEFRPDPARHKGERSTSRFLWPGVKERFEAILGVEVTEWEQYGWNGVFQFCVGTDEIVFHSDLQRWAGVVFLTPDPPPDAGTTLYRSRATKGRTVGESLARGAPATPGEVEHAMYDGKLLDPAAWEPVDVLGNVYNRLVLWDARMVHAASSYFGAARDDARLFQMFFFDSC